MPFFNKKEEVINIELTSHGKRVLSEGKFKPVYYSFFDDDIIYDSSYASYPEIQNDIEPRITGSLYMKPQAHYVGVESSISRAIKESRSLVENVNDAKFVYIPNIEEETFVYSKPMGNSSAYSTYLPAWSVKVWNSQLTSSSATLTGSRQPMPIPQLNANVDYAIKIIKRDQRDTVDINTMVESEYDLLQEYADGSAVLLRKKDIILQVLESHVDFERENFDMELFEITSSMSDGTCHYPEGRYSFIKANASSGDLVGMESEFAEYFLEINVDNQIDKEVLCDLGIVDKSNNLFDNRITACADDESRQTNESVYEVPVNSGDDANYCEDDET